MVFTYLDDVKVWLKGLVSRWHAVVSDEPTTAR